MHKVYYIHTEENISKSQIQGADVGKNYWALARNVLIVWRSSHGYMPLRKVLSSFVATTNIMAQWPGY